MNTWPVSPERMARGLYWERITWLKKQYVEERKTLAEIGNEIGVSAATIMRALKIAGVPRRGPKDKMTKRGSLNGNWKGSNVSYSAFHKRIYKLFGKAKQCEECGRTDTNVIYNWANLTGKLDDSKDYVSLCRKCHMTLDDVNRNRRKKQCKKPELNILRIRGIQ